MHHLQVYSKLNDPNYFIAEEKKEEELDFTTVIKLSIENMKNFKDYLLKKNEVTIIITNNPIE